MNMKVEKYSNFNKIIATIDRCARMLGCTWLYASCRASQVFMISSTQTKNSKAHGSNPCWIVQLTSKISNVQTNIHSHTKPEYVIGISKSDLVKE